MPGALE